MYLILVVNLCSKGSFPLIQCFVSWEAHIFSYWHVEGIWRDCFLRVLCKRGYFTCECICMCVCVRACCACALVGGCVRATRNVFRYVYVRYAYIEVVTLFVMTNNIRIFTGQLNINIFYYLNPGVHTWAVLCVALGFIMDVHM